jgi:hypothetical protein
VPRIVDSGGAVQVPVGQRGSAATVSAATLDLKQRFQSYAAAAANSPADEAAAANRMVRSGVLLARANCDDFFANAALIQQRNNISRDMVAPIISVLTNVLALQNLSDNDNDRALKILSIGSSVALAGISIIDQHFLFGAENIKEVRDLTFQGLAAHEEAIGQIGVVTFEDGIQQLIDHQVICSPASILGLTKQAIAAGEVSAETATSASLDEQALQQLGSTLNLIGPATPKQAAALWALYRGGVPVDAVPASLEANLQELGLSKLVNPAVAEQPAIENNPAAPARAATISDEGRAKADQVIAILKTFSPGTQGQLSQAAAGSAEGRTDLQDVEVVLQPTRSRARSVKLVVH